MKEIIIDKKTIECIQKNIEKLRKEKENEIQFPNAVLRDDVFALLSKYCRLIYYPFKDECNKAFRKMDVITSSGESLQFVYINTWHPQNLQVFAAGHELGHIWEIDKKVQEEIIESREISSEDIIDRFAAELLMPENPFRDNALRFFLEKADNERKLSVLDVLQTIAQLMYMFDMPYDAIVRRFIELELCSESSGSILLDEESKKEEFTKAIDIMLTNMGYSKILEKTEKKNIEGYAELLEKAEKQNKLSHEKIRAIREKMGYQLNSYDAFSNQQMDFLQTAGGDTNG